MTRRPRILFVDDEVQVLEGLADVLHKDRRRWELVFASTGAGALEELARAPVDIVVSDMRMPGMDGPELLTTLKRRHPGVMRIVLSGHADRDALVRAIGVAQQFLGKPCEAELLRGTLERALALREGASTQAIVQLVGSVSHLPSAPTTYLELGKLSADSSRGLADVAAVIERDTALSVRVLQLVNSTYFGARREIRAIHQAVGLVGVDLLKGLALTAGTIEAARRIQIPGFSLEREQRDAYLTAQLASRIVAPNLAEEAFTAAFVRRIGMIVLALALPVQVEQVQAELGETTAPRHEIERMLLGVTHPEVGAFLLGSWGLPFSLVEAVRHYYVPMRVPEEHRALVAAVHIADALLDERPARIDPALIGARLGEYQAIAERMRREAA